MRIFIGFDERQPVAFTVAALSIIANASIPVSITPLVLGTLPITRRGLTPFTYSRFLVPMLCDYEGQAVFMDSDFLCRTDIARLSLLNAGHAVHVVAHEKAFERASMMLFNCEKCKILTPEYVETSNGLHLIDWTDDVGYLPKEWNHLVGYDAPCPDAKLVHFTQGLPCFPQTRHDEHAEEWNEMAQAAVGTQSWETLMGNSVHAPCVLARQTEGIVCR